MSSSWILYTWLWFTCNATKVLLPNVTDVWPMLLTVINHEANKSVESSWSQGHVVIPPGGDWHVGLLHRLSPTQHNVWEQLFHVDGPLFFCYQHDQVMERCRKIPMQKIVHITCWVILSISWPWLDRGWGWLAPGSYIFMRLGIDSLSDSLSLSLFHKTSQKTCEVSVP